MAIMRLSDFAGYIGLSKTQTRDLYRAGRITGVIELSARLRIVDTATAKVLPPPNNTRRLTGGVIGRSKPLRGEEGFVEGQHKRKPK